MGITTNEFPLLNAVGLYVKDTEGNGNCLFNALSDQIYGDQSRHGELRSGVIRHMRENAHYYKQFIEVHPGGGVRRNPKRKTAGSFTTTFNNIAPTQAEIDRVFESHLKQMALGGTYGDNMEITAFSKAFHVDVRIYQRDFAYVVSTAPTGTVPMVHIAYHVWEHYSSIRNVAGPHSGLPQVKSIQISTVTRKDGKSDSSCVPYVSPWKVEVVIDCFPNLSADVPNVQRMIEECKGNVDDVISKLVETDEQSSTSSAGGSSSVEREVDSDDEEPIRGPNKRQDRRLSRAKRNIINEKEEKRNEGLSFRMKAEHVPVMEEPSSLSKDNHAADVKQEDADETDEEDWRNGSTCKDSESGSVSTSASDFSSTSKAPTGNIRLKLSQPKRDSGRCETPSSSLAEHTSISEPSGNENQHHRMVPAKSARVPIHVQRNIKKAAQKAASKERKKSAAVGRVIHGQSTALPLMKKQGKENATIINESIKVLYI